MRVVSFIFASLCASARAERDGIPRGRISL
jgi:hypothetical protein